MPVTQSQKLPSLNGPLSYLKSPTCRSSVSPRYNPISASDQCDGAIARIYRDRGSLGSSRGSSRTTSSRWLAPVPQRSPLHGRATTPFQRPPKRQVPVKRSQFPSGLLTLPSTSSPSLLGGPSSKCSQVISTQLPSTYQSPVKESLFASLHLQPPPGGTSRNHLFEVRAIIIFPRMQKQCKRYVCR